jgi:hypothetical protein
MPNKPEVALVNMPFGNLLTPSIGLGLLKSALAKLEIPSRVYNFQFRFAELIGPDNYSNIYGTTHTEELAGEFIFSSSLFGPNWASDVDRYVDHILRRKAPGFPGKTTYSETQLVEFRKIICESREKVEGFLDECLQAICSINPDLVGFTSLFHQHVA